MTRQSEIVAILQAFISEFESVQKSRIAQFSKFEIESLKSTFTSLELELNNARAELPRIESSFKARSE